MSEARCDCFAGLCPLLLTLWGRRPRDASEPVWGSLQNAYIPDGACTQRCTFFAPSGCSLFLL